MRGTEKKRKAKRTERRTRKNQGMITVFVIMIMVPVVAITGVMVDVARLKMYSSQAAMAADAYGAAVLSEFDNLLKQLYGLFAVTQNKEGMEAVEKMAEYASYSFNPNKDEKGLTGFMPYQYADMEVFYEKIEGASLSNNNVLMTQISDFMRYRIVEEVLDETGILGSLKQFDSLSADMEAMEERSDITDSSAKALGSIDEYYEELKKLAAYPSYLKGRQEAFEEYSKKMTEVIESDEYDDYVYYLEHRSDIEAILREFEDNADSSESDHSGDDDNSENLAEKEDIYVRFSEFDADKYKKDLKEEFLSLSRAAGNHDSSPIDFDNTARVIDLLGKRTKELETTLQRLNEQIQRLESQLSGCSREVQEGIREEVAQLNQILSLADDFRETYELIDAVHDDKGLNNSNHDVMKREVKELDQIRDKIVSGEAEPKSSPWPGTVPLVWYDFREDKGDFYSQLRQMCEVDGDENGDKNAGKKEIKRANKAQEDAEKGLDGDEKTAARDISKKLASQLKSSGTVSSNVPKLTDYFSGGLSFEALSKAGSNVVDKFLVTSYDFGMFSSRVSGIRPPEEEADDNYADYSLTKVKMSPDVNYLYGAELEYLFGGHNKSVSNLNETRNIICGVRLTMNFVSTYTIKEINDTIRVIADAAASAAASTGVGAAAAPLIRVAVSGALRMAVATIETAEDWSALKKREDVVLLKTELGDLESKEALESLLGITIGRDSSGKKPALSYEDYLYVLLCLLVDDNTLLSRTANLITLNVNQAMNSSGELTSLEFKMSDTVTAIKSTCKVKADFVVLPENIAQIYFSGTNVETLIESLEDQYFGYSVIRGY